MKIPKKNVPILLTLILCICITLSVNADVWVDGYYRDDGTYVEGHWRSNPDGNPYNNWSFPGNVNPYTGKEAKGNSNTYLKNYNNKFYVNNYNSKKKYNATEKESSNNKGFIRGLLLGVIVMSLIK